MSDRKGYRGYIGSRRYFGDRVPQHVQNLVVRDFCQRNGFQFLLSHTEYIMRDNFMMLEEMALEAPHVEGVVLYSFFMLPPDKEYRMDVCNRILDAGASMHGAVENKSVNAKGDLQQLEDLWNLKMQLGSGGQVSGDFV